MKYRATYLTRATLSLCAMLIVAGGLYGQSAQALPAQGDGNLLYAAGANTTPQLKPYTGSTNTFGSASGTIVGTQPNIVQQKSSPFKNEIIAGYEDTAGNLKVMCYDGTSWTNEWTISVGGTGTTRRFDIAYETSTGDVTVVYSRGVAAVNALAYRTKAGSAGCGAANWAAATNFPTTTSTTTGTIQWVKAARDSRSSSSLDAFIWADSNSDLGAAIWSGTAFTNFRQLTTTLEVVSAAQDIDNFELQYESFSGDLMVVWGSSVGTNGTQGALYSTCNGGTSACTWLTSTKISTATGDDAAVLDLSSDPTSDKMAFASIGTGNPAVTFANNGANSGDMQAAYWSGTAWTFYANLDITTELPAAGMRLTQTGWLTNNGITKWMLVYDDATGTGISWYVATPGSTPVAQTDFTTSPAIDDIRERYQIDNNPFDNSKLMLTLTDSTKGIMAERLAMDTSGVLTWTNASPGSAVATSNAIPFEGFSFQYRRYIPPGSLGTDIVDGGGSPVASPSVTMSGLASGSACQTASGSLGSATQKIRITNTTATPAWSLSIAATGGATANWLSGTATYDFNDAGGSGCSDGADADTLAGQLSVNPSVATNTPQSGCSASGITLGSASAFSQGALDNITIASGSGSAQTGCFWDITGVALSQQVPALQAAGSYAIPLTLTVVAN